jgi:hypothetical protein
MPRLLPALGFAALLLPASPAMAAPSAASPSAPASVESFSECVPNDEGIKERCENQRTVFKVTTTPSGISWSCRTPGPHSLTG